MISNSEISDILELTSKLLTLHSKDESRARALGAISFTIDRTTESLYEMSTADIQKIRGIGSSVASLIEEIKSSGSLEELQELISITPEGVLEMFKVKGLGVKKIQVLWKTLEIDNLNELRIACENGKIAGTKGFGKKTEESILASLVFLRAQAGKLRMNQAFELSEEIKLTLSKIYDDVAVVGQVKTKEQEVDCLSFQALITNPFEKPELSADFIENMADSSPFVWRGNYRDDKIAIEIHFLEDSEWVSGLVINASNENHLKKMNESLGKTFIQTLQSVAYKNEKEAYEAFGSNFIPAEMRVGGDEFEWIKNNSIEEIIDYTDLKGTVHNHSTYSDGKHTLRQMAEYCKVDLGLEYFGIADHSQSATYAGGLLASKVMMQWDEIDKLNEELAPFKILKGIESDILSDGSLDYSEEILCKFDYVVASVHSGLSMDIEKATDRLIKAIENPYTTILGHPTGRLLLSRKGYPVDFTKVIDACAANDVIMELNASPYRLDIDWKWIPYCLEKGVKISINPDAHSTSGLHDMQYGVQVARKARLTKAMTFNAMALEDVLKFLNKS